MKAKPNWGRWLLATLCLASAAAFAQGANPDISQAGGLLSQAVSRAVDNPALHERLLATGAEPVPSTPQELANLLRRDADKWSKLIAAKKIKVE